MIDSLTLRPASAADCRFYWEVNNAPDVREASVSTDPIPWESHREWFAASLDRNERHLCVATVGEARIGVARFDLDADQATISLALHEEHRGHGYGTEIIRSATSDALQLDGVERAVAHVKLDNPASVRAFLKAGYGYVGMDDVSGQRLLRFEQPGPTGEVAMMELYFDRLWPILRSITGDGVRQTHRMLSELIELETHEVKTGSPVLDWFVPREWRASEAYIVTPSGERICDLAENNLHLLNYSVPFQGTLSREELDDHLYSLPDQPDAIPYLTSYYSERWGFCLTQDERDALSAGTYEVVVDTELFDGSLTWSEVVLPGESDEEVLFSTYTCHPSMANNELSGPLVAAFLCRRLAARERRRFTYRFVFIPETIGSITVLAQHGERLKEKLAAGYVITCVGDEAPFTYKRSRQGNSLADRAAEAVLKEHAEGGHTVLDFFPDKGSDERQYCSPGFDLPVGSLMRSMYQTFPEYHTSLDNKDFVSMEALVGSVDMYERVVDLLEVNRTYRNLQPYGEPNLGRRGLYPTLGGLKDKARALSALMWFLNLSDGVHDLLAISRRSGISFEELQEAAEKCLDAGICEVVGQSGA